MNGDRYIHQLIINTKIGNEKDFKILWNAYSFLIDQIYWEFCKLYPHIKNNRIETYNFIYLWFWEAIDSYDFKDNDFFSYKVKNTIINNFLVYLNKEYGIHEELLINKNVFKKRLKKEIWHRNKKLYYGLRNLTTKQLQVIWINMYEGIIIENCIKILKTNHSCFYDRLR
ncbi:hypothetical protein M0P65_07200, partial [Candidatus Gracilibacteria bacterium]|nr:hypothetical protein [Candidatus Gracilibacteria bacterium]